MFIIVFDDDDCNDDESQLESQIFSFWMENLNHKKIYDPITYAHDCKFVDLMDICKMNVKHKSIMIEMGRKNVGVQQFETFIDHDLFKWSGWHNISIDHEIYVSEYVTPDDTLG